MKIYLLEQDLNNGYDTYDSVVVIAENENEARKIHPSGFITHIKDGNWMGTYAKGGEYEYNGYAWVKADQIDQIKVTYIGEATDKQKKGVLLASYNAG